MADNLVTGRGGALSFGTTATSAQSTAGAILGEVTEWTTTESTDIVDTSNLTSGLWGRKKVVGKNWTASVTANFDSTQDMPELGDEGFAFLSKDNVSPASATKYRVGACVVSEIGESQPNKDVIKITMTITGTAQLYKNAMPS